MAKDQTIGTWQDVQDLLHEVYHYCQARGLRYSPVQAPGVYVSVWVSSESTRNYQIFTAMSDLNDPDQWIVETHPGLLSTLLIGRPY